jgi:hypothetical protein
LHVAHVGGHPGLLPLAQALAARFERFRAPHANEVEARLARTLLQDTPRRAGIYPRSVHGQRRLNQTKDERDGDAMHVVS